MEVRHWACDGDECGMVCYGASPPNDWVMINGYPLRHFCPQCQDEWAYPKDRPTIYDVPEEIRLQVRGVDFDSNGIVCGNQDLFYRLNSNTYEIGSVSILPDFTPNDEIGLIECNAGVLEPGDIFTREPNNAVADLYLLCVKVDTTCRVVCWETTKNTLNGINARYYSNDVTVYKVIIRKDYE